MQVEGPSLERAAAPPSSQDDNRTASPPKAAEPSAGPASPGGQDTSVIMERCYDLCHSTGRRLGTFAISDRAIHNRRSSPKGQAANAVASSTQVEGARETSAASWSSESSSAGSAERALEEAFNRKYSTRRQISAPNEDNIEIITRWGVLAGKVLHCISLGLHVKGKDGRSTMQMMTGGTKKRLTNSRAESKTAPEPYGPSEFLLQRAWLVIEQTKSLTQALGEEANDVDDHDWYPNGLLPYMFGGDYVETLFLLAVTARQLLASQPVLAEVSPPCKIFGDIHGQLRDMLLLFRCYGAPWQERSQDLNFVFNGDFVDRGKHQLEVIGLLLALKIVKPKNVWLVRGNHEDIMMNEKYGFWEECIAHLGDRAGLMIFLAMQKAFDQLPLACLVAQCVLVVHGGIGDGKWSLDDLRAVKRPLSVGRLHSEEYDWVWNILWSDPIEDDEVGQASVFGVHASPRSKQVKKFGWDVTKVFCARNGLKMVVRSHQSKVDGLGLDVMHDQQLVRVFSARDYSNADNCGAVLWVRWFNDKCPGDQMVIRPQVLLSRMQAKLLSAVPMPPPPG